MDPITHGLAGITISQLGFNRKAAFWVLLISAVAPDLDYITYLWGVETFLKYHRGVTHGIFAIFLFPLIMAFIFGLKKGFLYFYFVSFLGYNSHILLDLTNQYGTRILSPLDWEQFSLDLTFIIDPYISVGLLLCVMLCLFNKKRAVLISSLTIMLLFGYFGGRYYLRNASIDFLKSKVDANIYRVCPLPNDFLRWWYIVKSGDEVKTGFVDLFTQRIYQQEVYIYTENDPLIKKSKETKTVQNFLFFARNPYVEVKKDKETAVVLWRELSYSFIPGEHFTAKVVFDKNSKILKARFKF